MSYAGLAVIFVGIAAVAALCAAWWRRPGRQWWQTTVATTVVLLLLTAVFDNLIIAADLVRYSVAAGSGLRVGVAPIEDFAWPLAAGLGLPSLWLLLDRKGRDGHHGHHAPRGSHT